MRPIYLFSISPHPDSLHVNPLEIIFFKPQIDFSSYDYLVLTSKQAVKALQQYDANAYKNSKALCISNVTAKAYEALGGEVLTIGAGYGNDLAKIITKYPKQTRWLYLRAKEVASDFAVTCNASGYHIDEAIIYESRCSKEIASHRPADDAVLIFTSPSSVKCFLKHFNIKPTQDVIVIGHTTKKALPESISVIVAKETNIQACIQIAKTL